MDPVVRSASKRAALSGDDLNHCSIWNATEGFDLSPFCAGTGMVPGKDAGEISRVEVTNLNVAIGCDNLSGPDNAVSRLSGKATADAN